ncbi:MAG: hypothetical protein PHC51_01290 [bacterium]|nr:hypothetical protein [bacterium]
MFDFNQARVEQFGPTSESEVFFINLLSKKPQYFVSWMKYDLVSTHAELQAKELRILHQPFLSNMFKDLIRRAASQGWYEDIALHSYQPVVVAYDLDEQCRVRKSKKSWETFFSSVGRNNLAKADLVVFPGMPRKDNVWIQVLPPGYIVQLRPKPGENSTRTLARYVEQIKIDTELGGDEAWKYIVAVNGDSVDGYAYIEEKYIDTFVDRLMVIDLAGEMKIIHFE